MNSKRYAMVLLVLTVALLGCGESGEPAVTDTTEPTPMADAVSPIPVESDAWFESTGAVESNVNDAIVEAEVLENNQLSIMISSLPYATTIQLPTDVTGGETFEIASSPELVDGKANATFTYEIQSGDPEDEEGAYNLIDNGTVTITERTEDSVSGTFRFTARTAAPEDGAPSVTVQGGFESVERPPQ